MKPITVTFDPATLAQFRPEIQEALWRLARQGEPEHDPRTPNERLRQSTKAGETEAQFEARRSKVMNKDGSINTECDLKPGGNPR